MLKWIMAIGLPLLGLIVFLYLWWVYEHIKAGL